MTAKAHIQRVWVGGVWLVGEEKTVASVKRENARTEVRSEVKHDGTVNEHVF